jgi:hypothetical protein
MPLAVSSLSSYRFTGAAVAAVGGGASAAFEKKVVTVMMPATEVPGVTRYVPDFVAALESFKSPTLMMRESLPSLEKKSSTAKYGPSQSTSKGTSK